MDLVYRRVPNTLLVVGLLLQAMLVATLPEVALGTPLAPTVVYAVLGLALGLCAFFPLWRLGVMGAGDVKFMAVLGFALGPKGLLVTWLVGTALAAIPAVSSVLLTRAASSAAVAWVSVHMSGITRPIWQVFAPARSWLASRRGTRQGAPYATYLAIGAFAWVLVLSRQ